MNKATFKIRRKIILAFLFCFLSVLVFAILSFQIHREISHRLRLVEVADDLVNNILEIRRFEKNFFLYKQHHSLEEAASYVDGVERLYKEHEKNILRLTQKGTESRFGETLADYKKTLSQIKTSLQSADGREAAVRHFRLGGISAGDRPETSGYCGAMGQTRTNKDRPTLPHRSLSIYHFHAILRSSGDSCRDLYLKIDDRSH